MTYKVEHAEPPAETIGDHLYKSRGLCKIKQTWLTWIGGQMIKAWHAPFIYPIEERTITDGLISIEFS